MYWCVRTEIFSDVSVSVKGFEFCAAIDSIYPGNTCICYLWYS